MCVDSHKSVMSNSDARLNSETQVGVFGFKGIFTADSALSGWGAITELCFMNEAEHDYHVRCRSKLCIKRNVFQIAILGLSDLVLKTIAFVDLCHYRV